MKELKKNNILDEKKEYNVNDFVVGEVVNVIIPGKIVSTNRICIFKKDEEENLVFYDIISGLPFVSYDYLQCSDYIFRLGARIPLSYYYPEKDMISTKELIEFNKEVLKDGFEASQKSKLVKKYIK